MPAGGQPFRVSFPPCPPKYSHGSCPRCSSSMRESSFASCISWCGRSAPGERRRWSRWCARSSAPAARRGANRKGAARGGRPGATCEHRAARRLAAPYRAGAGRALRGGHPPARRADALERSPYRQAPRRSGATARPPPGEQRAQARPDAQDRRRAASGHPGKTPRGVVQAGERPARSSAQGARRDAAARAGSATSASAHQRQDPRHLGRGPARRIARPDPDPAAVRAQCEAPARLERNRGSSRSGARPGRRAGKRRLAADRREVPARGLPPAARRLGIRRPRRRAAGGRRALARGGIGGGRDPRQIPRHRRIPRTSGDPLPAHRRTLRGGRAPTGSPRPLAAAPPRGAGRPDHALRDPEQPPDGIPHPGHRETVERSMEGTLRGQDRVRQVRGRARQGEEAARYGVAVDRPDRHPLAAIERRLRSVEELPPEDDPAALLGLSAAGGADGGEEQAERA